MATTPACLGNPPPLNSLLSLSQTLTISLSRRPASTDLLIFSLSSSGGNSPPMTTSASLNLPPTSSDNLIEEAAGGGSAGKSFRERDKEGFSESAIMEGGLPMLNCLLQHTLRNLCTSSDSSTSTKWVYAVFWRILPRNYPPPKWDYGGGALDRAKGNKRNWILVWEDGFCDFYECERAGNVKGMFGADVFFKMSHEVYSYGEGMVGKVAADNSHKWVFKDNPSENDSSFITSWNVLIDPIREFHTFLEENLSLTLS